MPSDGESLVWNEGHGHWMPGTIDISSTNIVETMMTLPTLLHPMKWDLMAHTRYSLLYLKDEEFGVSSGQFYFASITLVYSMLCYDNVK